MGSLSSCGHVQIKDHEWCADKGSLGAVCFHNLTNESRHITKAEWDDMRFGQICTNDPIGHKGETFADWKSVIEKLCSDYKACTYEDKKAIEVFFSKVERLQNEH